MSTPGGREPRNPSLLWYVCGEVDPVHVYEEGVNIHGPYRARMCVADSIAAAEQIRDALQDAALSAADLSGGREPRDTPERQAIDDGWYVGFEAGARAAALSGGSPPQLESTREAVVDAYREAVDALDELDAMDHPQTSVDLFRDCLDDFEIQVRLAALRGAQPASQQEGTT